MGETWLHLSDSAGDRCPSTMDLSAGVCLVCKEAGTQWACLRFSPLPAFPQDHSEQPGNGSESGVDIQYKGARCVL